MKPSGIYDIIRIDEYSATPKYLQLTNSILKGIEDGRIHKDDLLPSINELSYELEIARDTAEKGYKHLKKLGILSSVPGKGYFIKETQFGQVLKVFLLFNKLSAHKKIIYDSFVAALGTNVAIDFYIYNNDLSLFKKLLATSQKDYSYYVIIPHFMEGGEDAHEIINTIPKEKLLLLDKKIAGIEGEYAAAYENFSKDIYGALVQALEPLKKYHTIKIVFPDHSYFPNEILQGLKRFCGDYAFTYEVIHQIAKETIAAGNVYINLMEDDLVALIEKINELQLKIGEEVGIISYNETPMKKIILNGITTISTDFKKMGQLAAGLMLDHSKKHVEVPFYLTLRKSL